MKSLGSILHGLSDARAGARRGPRLPIIILLLLVLAPVLDALRSQGAKGSDGDRGDDDVGTLPSVAAPGMDLVLLGSLADLRAAVLTVQGTGDVTVEPFHDDAGATVAWLSMFTGDVQVQLAESVLATGGVDARLVHGSAFDGGVAAVQIGGAWFGPFPLDTAGQLDVPLAALAALPLGEHVAFEAVGPDGHHYRLDLGERAPGVLFVGQQSH